MAREEIRVDLTANDEASKVIGKVADKAEKLEKVDPEVEVTADDQASRKLDALEADVRRLEAMVVDLSIKADTTQVETALKRTGDGVRNIGDEADNSRSVLANMAGNATQDLGALGGVAGSAGVAIGQLAEYATEGNIALSGLIKTAGPMLAIATAVSLITSKLNDARKKAEETKKATEGIVEALRAGEVEAAAKAIGDQFGDLLLEAERLGFSMEHTARIIAGEGGDAMDLLTAGTLELTDAESAFIAEVFRATTALKDENTVQANSADLQGRVARTLGAVTDATDDATGATDELTHAYERLQGRLDDESSYLSAVAGIDSYNDALADAMLATEEFGADSEEAQDANRELAQQLNSAKSDVLAYAASIGNIPPEVASEITLLLDQGKFREAELRLAALEQTRTAHVNLEVVYGRNRPLGYPASAPWPPPGGTTRSAPTTNVTVNLPRGSRPSDTIRAVENYARRNGRKALR